MSPQFPEPGRPSRTPTIGGMPQAWPCARRSRRRVSPLDQISALACDTTSCTVVALDAEGRPLRPCLLWMDVRAHREAAEVAACGDPALRLNGGGAGPVSPEWMIPKALWIKRNQPDIWARTAMVGEYQDYMTLRLTGRWAASLNNVTMRWHHQPAAGPRRCWPCWTCPIWPSRWPQEIVAPGQVIGPLTPDAAAHLGLLRGHARRAGRGGCVHRHDRPGRDAARRPGA